MPQYDGNCHCGAVKYTITIPKPLSETPVYRCNCSICTKNGYHNVFPSKDDVIFHQGQDYLKTYEYGGESLPSPISIHTYRDISATVDARCPSDGCLSYASLIVNALDLTGKNVVHYFCPTCGGNIMIDLKKVMENTYAVNVRDLIP